MARGMTLLHDVGWYLRDNDLPGAVCWIRTGMGRLRNGPVRVPEANQKRATAALNQYDHGSPMWRFAVLVASGRVTREDLRILAEVVESLDG